MDSNMYDCVRYGPGANDWRLVLRQPIQTRDAARAPRGVVARIRSTVAGYFASKGWPARDAAALQQVLTSDELLTPMTSGTTISRGSTWSATAGAEPEVHAVLGPVRDFVRGFIPGNIVDALNPGTVIDLARQYNASTHEDEKRESLKRAIDAAEEAWEKRVPGTEPSDLVATRFTPGADLEGKRGARDTMQLGEILDASSRRQSKDSLSRVARSGTRLLAGVRENLYNAARTADYARNMAAGRKEPAIVGATPAANYARTMAAARAKMEAEKA